MACTHLKQLFRLCQEHDVRFSGADLVRIVCRECESEEVCPSVLMDEYDATQPTADGNEPQQIDAGE